MISQGFTPTVRPCRQSCGRLYFFQSKRTSGSNFEPRPPEYPPPSAIVDYDAWQQERISLAVQLEESVQNQTQLQEEVVVLKTSWKDEKATLQSEVEKLRAKLETSEDNDSDRLQREVDLLQDNVLQAINALKVEQRKVQDLERRLSDAASLTTNAASPAAQGDDDDDIPADDVYEMIRHAYDLDKIRAVTVPFIKSQLTKDEMKGLTRKEPLARKLVQKLRRMGSS